MTVPHGGAVQIYRDYETGTSGALHKPIRSEARDWGAYVEGVIAPFDGLGVATSITGSGDVAKDSAVKAYVDAHPILADTAVTASSGTAISFAAVPSWARKVTVVLDRISMVALSMLHLRIGDATAYLLTGYRSKCANFGDTAATNHSSGFGILDGAAPGDLASGTITLININGTTWIYSSAIMTSAGAVVTGAGGADLTGPLTRVRLSTAAGTDTFNGGTINAFYE